MNPGKVDMRVSSFADKRRYICIGILAVFFVSFAGFATAAVTGDGRGEIREQDKSSSEYMSGQVKKDSATEWSNRTRFGGDMRLRAAGDRAGSNNMQIVQSSPAATSRTEAVINDRQSPKDPADQGFASLVELLQKKKVISSAEADRIVKQAAGRRGGAAPDLEGVAALAVLLESKKIIGPDEAARFTKQYAGRNAEINDNVRNEKMTAAAVSEELRKDIREQVKQQVREELAGEDKTREKEKIQEIDQNMSYLTQKVAEMLYGGKVGELAKESMPDWMKRFRFSGDIRLRYEKDLFDKNNAILAQPSDPSQLMNTAVDADRFKYRVRLGLEADINDELGAIVRLSTGNTTNPVSTNQILGDFMNKDSIVFDLAYLKWKAAPYLTLYGGRMPNPWFSSELVWDNDLNFEGLAVAAKKPITESLTPFLTVGAFPLQQNDFTARSKWLVAGQLGVERKDPRGIGAKIGAAYYRFSNITGVFNDTGTANATDWSAPLFQQKGNTLFNIQPDPLHSDVVKTALASEFRELNLTGTLDIGFWDPVHIILLGDYVKNIGFKKADVANRTGVQDPAEETTGYQLGLSVGYPKIEKLGQWKAQLYYRYLGADAVVDAFADSDFHLGGTNAKGWILGTEFGLAKNTWLTLRWLTANEIKGLPLAIDVLQLDLNARF